MPSMQRTKEHRTPVFGDIRIRQAFNSMKDPMSPDFILHLYDKRKLLLQLKEASFDDFYSSPDNGLFLGLSNRGLARHRRHCL